MSSRKFYISFRHILIHTGHSYRDVADIDDKRKLQPCLTRLDEFWLRALL